MFWAEKKRFILLFRWLLLSYEYRRETDISFCKQHNEVHTILLVHYLLNKFTIFSNLKRIKFLSHFASCFVLSNFKWKKKFFGPHFSQLFESGFITHWDKVICAESLSFFAFELLSNFIPLFILRSKVSHYCYAIYIKLYDSYCVCAAAVF